MAQKIWTIPYIDQPISFWQDLNSDFGTFIDQVYMPAPLDNISTGRPQQSEQYVHEFLKNSPFNISLLINPIIFFRPIEDVCDQVVEGLKDLYQNYSMIKAVTVSNLTLAEKIKKAIPELELNASVLMDIFAPNQFEYLDDVFDVLVPSSRITRDISALADMKRNFDGEIKLILNEGCLPGCVYRTQHFYEMCAQVDYPKSLCQSLLEKKPWLRLVGSWILPQHLHFYDGVYDKLKLSGRVTLQNPAYYRDVLAAYLFRQQRRVDRIGGGPVCGNYSVDISAGIFKKLIYCNKNCSSCSVCEEIYRSISIKSGRIV